MLVFGKMLFLGSSWFVKARDRKHRIRMINSLIIFVASPVHHPRSASSEKETRSLRRPMLLAIDSGSDPRNGDYVIWNLLLQTQRIILLGQTGSGVWVLDSVAARSWVTTQFLAPAAEWVPRAFSGLATAKATKSSGNSGESRWPGTRRGQPSCRPDPGNLSQSRHVTSDRRSGRGTADCWVV